MDMAIGFTFTIVFAYLFGRVITMNHSIDWSNSIDMGQWSRLNKFFVVDSIVFHYYPPHDVLQVNETSFHACQPHGAITYYDDGETLITLREARVMYFICDSYGYCASGMRIRVEVQELPKITPPTQGYTGSPPLASSISPPANISPPPASNSYEWLIIILIIVMLIFVAICLYICVKKAGRSVEDSDDEEEGNGNPVFGLGDSPDETRSEIEMTTNNGREHVGVRAMSPKLMIGSIPVAPF